MELVNTWIASLEELQTKYKKIGTATRTTSWIEAERETISSICRGLETIEASSSEAVDEALFSKINKGRELARSCLGIIDKIAISTEKKQVPKMANFDLITASKLVKEYNGRSSARDYVDTIEVYNETLSEAGSLNLAKYVYKSCLKEDAKKAFLKVPLSVADISSVLLKRFQVRETVAGLNQKLSYARQGNRTVNKFATVIEGITADLIDLHLSKRGETAREVVQAIADESACDSFKAGLRPDVQAIVIASGASTFTDAVDKALQAEASLNCVGEVNNRDGYDEPRGCC